MIGNGSLLEGAGGVALALAIGMLIGLERGWRERDVEDQGRIAGLRTFTLLGVSGGVAATLAPLLGPWILAALLIGVAGLMAVAYAHDIARDQHWSATTVVTALLTVLLGALATVPHHAMLAAATAVLVALVLALRDPLHNWLRRLTADELRATLRFLLIAVVILPWLPDQAFGPYGVLNPFKLWLLVVLICGLSFAGYIATRWLGVRRGLMAAAAAGALVSSTVVTLTLARQARAQPESSDAFAAAMLLANGVMAVRVAVLAVVVHSPLIAQVGPVLGTLAVLTLGAALIGLRASAAVTPTLAQPRNPLALRGALVATAGVALIMLLGRWVEARIGTSGLYAVAAIGGLLDVDAVTVSMADLSRSALPGQTAMQAILIAVGVNALVKLGLAVVIAPAAVWRRLALGLAPALAGASLVAVLI